MSCFVLFSSRWILHFSWRHCPDINSQHCQPDLLIAAIREKTASFNPAGTILLLMSKSQNPMLKQIFRIHPWMKLQ